MRFAIGFVFLAACAAEDPAERSPTRPAPPAAATAPRDQPFVDTERRLMGTVFVVRALGEPETVRRASQRALDEVERLEGVLSEWRPASDISRVNAAAGGEAVAVSDDTVAVLREALTISRVSEGAFDASWAALRDLYDFRAEHPVPPTAAKVASRLRYVRWQDVQLDESAKTLRLARRGMAVGTGGIGKGYALDRASEVLLSAGVENFMIYGGGQVQVHGRRPDRPFRVGIQHPRESRLIASFETSGESIATSGDYEHSFFDSEGRRVHHIVDPATGLPSTRSISVTIATPSGMRADALSTAVFVLGADAGLAMLERLGGDAEAAIVDAECVFHVTDGLRARMHFELELEPGDVVPGCRGVP